MGDLATFSDHRGLLFTVAYEVLGTVSDAEDVLQDSYLRWTEVDEEQVRDPRSYLVRIVTRQALNKLRSLKRQRETYVGPWLPEPLLTTADVAEDVELAESVSLAMLVVLETLSPLERAVFVLRDVFGFEYDEIAAATAKTPAAVRQAVSRARKHVQARRPRVDLPEDHREITGRFFAAATTGDLQPLMDLMAPDVVLLSDGGGKRQAALRPLHGPDKVARWLCGVVARTGEVSAEWATVNGGPALLLYVDGELDSVASVTIRDRLLQQILIVRNPDKLAALVETRSLSRG